MQPSKRFRIAFSFPGERRSFVEEIATALSQEFGEEAILYDRFHTAELARANLAMYLPDLYSKSSELVVVFLCDEYSSKEWCGLEWRAIFDVIKQRRDIDVMFFRDGDSDIPGLYGIDGFVSLSDITSDAAVRLILQRLAINSGLDRDHYLTDHRNDPPIGSLTTAYPLSQLLRRAHNAKSEQDRHLVLHTVFDVILKLLGSVLIVDSSVITAADAELQPCLRSLARPSLTHWWDFVRRLLPALAAHRSEYSVLCDFVFNRPRTELPHCSQLLSALAMVLDGEHLDACLPVRVCELFDKLVRYQVERARRRSAYNESTCQPEIAAYLQDALVELLDHIDVLAGNSLVFVSDVRRLRSGEWRVEAIQLSGDSLCRLCPPTIAEEHASTLPRPGEVYLAQRIELGARPIASGEAYMWLPPYRCASMHPLLCFNVPTRECFFLNSRPDHLEVEYLCYTTGAVLNDESLTVAHQTLLSRVLNRGVIGKHSVKGQNQAQLEQPMPEKPSDQLNAPRRAIGDFELLSVIGRGGMGKVYRAWQPSLGKQVALKTLIHVGDEKAEA